MNGKELKELIKRCGLTQEEAAVALEVTRRTLVNWIKSGNFSKSEEYIFNKLNEISHAKKSQIKIFSSEPISFEYKNVKKNEKSVIAMEVQMLKRKIEYLEQYIKIQQDTINMLKENIKNKHEI